MADWTFITNHGLVLFSIANNSDKTAREIADDVGITERTAHKIIKDLEIDGYITKTKVGRRNIYTIHPNLQIKVCDASVGDLLMTLGWRHIREGKQAQLSMDV